MTQMSSTTLFQTLWNAADVLRSQMDASEYKDYLLGLIFYKYLSDKMLLYAADLLEQPTHDLEEAQALYEAAWQSEDKDALIEELQYQFSYSLKPELTFLALAKAVEDKTFQLVHLEQAFRDIEQSDPAFENLFEEVDLYSKKLGNTPQKQNHTISRVMSQLQRLNLFDYEGDVLGDAYEYLLATFASESGKKAGEFYTPQEISKIMTRIVISGKEHQKGFTAYDPTMGSGSLLLNVKKYSQEPGTVSLFGQEINTGTYNLARMNMILHNVSIDNQHLRNGDTLDQDWPTDEPTNFDAVLMNPPYSAHYSAAAGFLDDPRFSPYGVLPPRTKADYAFLLHGYYHLKQGGVMAIILPHGVLFRGASEGKIREILLREGAIEAVIGLPANIFYSTSIPTTILILKKDRETRDVLFIDASQEFEKVKTQNVLTDDHIQKIVDTYLARETVPGYAHLATFDEIVENEFNLNIPRYVDGQEEEEIIPLTDVSRELTRLRQEMDGVIQEIESMMGELQGTTPEAQEELQEFIRIIQDMEVDV